MRNTEQGQPAEMPTRRLLRMPAMVGGASCVEREVLRCERYMVSRAWFSSASSLAALSSSDRSWACMGAAP